MGYRTLVKVLTGLTLVHAGFVTGFRADEPGETPGYALVLFSPR